MRQQTGQAMRRPTLVVRTQLPRDLTPTMTSLAALTKDRHKDWKAMERRLRERYPAVRA